MYRQAEGDPEATILYLKDSGGTNVVCGPFNSTTIPSDRPSQCKRQAMKTQMLMFDLIKEIISLY